MTKKQKLIRELESKISASHVKDEDLSGIGSLTFYKDENESFIFSANAVDYAPNKKDYRPLTINDITILLAK